MAIENACAGAVTLATVGGGVVISITFIKGSWKGVTRSTVKEIFQAKLRVKTENWGSKFLTPVVGESIESMGVTPPFNFSDQDSWDMRTCWESCQVY